VLDLEKHIVHQAKAARQHASIKQLIAHQYTIIGRSVLHSKDLATIEGMPQWRAYLKSLQALIDEYKVLQRGAIEIYEADNQRQLFAYRLTSSDARAFVAFNFSFDLQQMPLPFGFMASTKISLWQSDMDEVQTFVTSQPLMIRPFTAMIVIVP